VYFRGTSEAAVVIGIRAISKSTMGANKMKKILAIVLLSATFTAHAEGFSIGGDIGMVTYPDYTSDIQTLWLGPNSSVSQNLVSATLDIHGGQWINDYFGWEVGFADLGSVSGSYNSAIVNGSYKYSAAALHVAALGGIPLGKGKLFGKAGLFSATTKLEDNCFVCIPSQTLSSTGLMIGGGYELWFTPHISGRVGLNLYNGVKFINEATYAAESKSMLQAAVGANFTF